MHRTASESGSGQRLPISDLVGDDKGLQVGCILVILLIRVMSSTSHPPQISYCLHVILPSNQNRTKHTFLLSIN